MGHSDAAFLLHSRVNICQGFAILAAMPTPKETRAATAKAKAADIRAKKLHVIAERRAKAAKMDKAEFIAEIVKGNYPPITAEDIAEEPTPEAEAE